MNVSWVRPIEIVDLLIADAYRDEYISNDRIIRNSGFEIQPLGALCDDIYRGNTPPHRESAHWNTQTPKIVKTVNIRPNLCDMSSVFDIEPEVYFGLPKFQLSTSDIAITIMGATPEIIGRAWAYQSWIGKACFSDAVAAIKNVTRKLDREYLASYLNSHFGHHSIMRWSGSSTREYITNTALKRIPIPIPDPKIQAYIGDKVRLAEKCREEAGNVYEEGQKLLDSSLDLPAIQEQMSYSWFIEPSKDMIFGRLNVQTYKPAYTMASRQLLERPDCQSLGNLIGNGGKDITGGATPLRASYPNLGIPFLRVQNVQKNYLDLTGVVYIDSLIHSTMKRSQVKPYDVIFTITGYPGSATCVSPDLLPLNMNQHSVRFSVRSDRVDPFFLAAFLNSDYGYVQVKQRATGATRDALDYPSIKSILVPVIDLTLQKRIGRFFRQYAFYRRQAERLIQEAKSDVESLIGGELNSEAILAGLISSPTWDGIENQLNKHLLNYA